MANGKPGEIFHKMNRTGQIWMCNVGSGNACAFVIISSQQDMYNGGLLRRWTHTYLSVDDNNNLLKSSVVEFDNNLWELQKSFVHVA